MITITRWTAPFLLLLAVFSCPPLWAWPVSLEITAAEVHYQGARLQQVQLQTVGQAGIRISSGQAALDSQNDSQADLQASQLSLLCKQLGDAMQGWCPEGEWQLQLSSRREAWQQPLQGRIAHASWNDQQQDLTGSLVAGSFQASWQFRAGEAANDGPAGLQLQWLDQGLDTLPFKGAWPEQLDWIKTGISSGAISLAWPQPAAPGQAGQDSFRLPFKLQLRDLSLDSPDGRIAAEGLKLSLEGQWQTGDTSQLQLQAEFLAGEVLLDQFYTSFGPHSLRLDTRLSVTGQRVEVMNFQLGDGHALQLQASAGFSLPDPVSTLKYQVRQLDMQFPLAYERYLEPALASLTLDKLAVTGGFSWTGRGQGGEFPSGSLRFDDLSVVDQQRGRFAFTGMSAQIEAGQADSESGGQSEFSWRGMLLGRINLGAGQIALNTAPGRFELAKPLRLEILGGAFEVDQFSLQLPAAEAVDQDPVVNFNAGLDGMDMTELTAALGWPTFAGKISGRIPGVSYHQGVLTVDGDLSLEAFDGQIRLSELRVERPFGVLPSLAANLDVHDLDLQLLSSAFSFGSIAGRLDGYVHDLRMLDWSPVSFDAWMGTPERQSGPRNISQKAVKQLTSFGGGGATAALTGPIMRMFSTFSYRRLGMGCKLENYVCVIRGLADEDNSVLIMEGSGIPKLSIRVFNRSMDWPQLVANLAAASAGEDIRIGDP